ncbi:hypothetical protein [Burkholderia gladioli]|uniref:hypothetical protein n=1 Tax=Burkholderia gladioli TaxID=28095 RepID=UPI0012D2CA68|nr:hypothetical protein [Burkholderia gladioli]
MATLVCNYPLSEHDVKLAVIIKLVREVTEDALCQPERSLGIGGQVFVTIRGMDDLLAIQCKLTLQGHGFNPQVTSDGA